MILYIKAMETTTTTKTPVQMLIDEFGSLRSLARSIQRDPAAVCRWQKNGLVPTNVQKKVLQVCWDKGYKISAHDLIFGK